MKNNDKICRNCSEYDSPRGSKSGYCVINKARTGTGVVMERHSCPEYTPGTFANRLRIRRSKNDRE